MNTTLSDLCPPKTLFIVFSFQITQIHLSLHCHIMKNNLNRVNIKIKNNIIENDSS
jgi:hypothetical protein